MAMSNTNARIRMPSWLHEKATNLATDQGSSLNQFIVDAVQQAVANAPLKGGQPETPSAAARFLLEYQFDLDAEDAEDFLLLARERALDALTRTGAAGVEVRSLRLLPVSLGE